MKTSTKIYWTMANALFVLAVYIVLGVGRKAQSIFLFSVMKDFEFSGILATNALSAVSTPAGETMLQMNPIRGSHSIVLFLCVLWSLLGLILIWFGNSKSHSVDKIDD